MEEQSAGFQPSRVEHLIFRDELTEVFNRRYLYQYLPEEISRSKSVSQNLWLFMIDIDDFKSVNDKYGHLRGDEILKAVAAILKQCIRSEDTLIRYAGDEFTIVLPGADLSATTLIAKRINATVAKTPIKSSIPGQPDLNVNLSIGVANFPDDAPDAIRLIDLADKALYISKQKGKNRISFVTDISTEALRAKEILEVFPCPKLIEREEAMNKISQAYSNVVKEGRPKFILTSSQVGFGNSRLLEESSRAIEKKGGQILFSKCSESFITQPYRNLLVNLENYLKSARIKKEKLLNNLSSEQLVLLSKMLPALRDSFGLAGLSAQEAGENKEGNVESALRQFIVNISLENPLCIIFDDFQWVDEYTLKLIVSLKKETCRVFILASLIKEEQSQETSEYPVSRLKGALQEGLDEEVALTPLSYLGTREMISSIFHNMERSEKFDSLIYKITKGNPLFIEELLKFLIQKGFIYYHKGQWGKIEIQEPDIPHTLEEVILERFKSLDKTTQELISKAAVIGHDFSTELLHRLGKQDEGYVLDILESAQRAGLIKNRKTALKETPSGEELSFVSDEIRRVLYGLIEQDKIKNLHQQLGEIEEGLYSDNIDRIAGELFYHFKKAEDYHRAKAYAAKIEEAQGLVYDRALKYAQEILEGVEEKKVTPLSGKNMELSADVLRRLYILNINTLLYPQGSSVITEPLEEAFNKLSEIFVRDEVLVFSQVKGTLVVNGQRFKEGLIKKMFEESFLSFLKSSHIENITFKRGLTKVEFSDFIRILTHSAGDKTLAEQLKAKGIYQIEIGEESYALPSSAEKVQEREKLEEAMLLDYLLSKLSGADKTADMPIDWDVRSAEMAQVLNQMAEKAAVGPEKEGLAPREAVKAQVVQKAFQNIGSQLMEKSPNEWERYKKGLAKTILNLEPKLRREVLLGAKIEEGLKRKDILKELAPEFPDDIVVDLLAEELKEQKSSSARMRSLTQKFLWDKEQKQRITPLLKDKFARSGLPKEDLAWILGEQTWKDFNLEDKVKKFVSMAAQDYLNLEAEVDINALIAEILSNDRQDLFNAVLKKWKEFLKVPAVDLRRRILKSFMRIIESIPISRPELLIILFDVAFLQLESEEQLDIYCSVLNEITKPLGYLIDSGNFVHAKIILDKLNKEKSRVKQSLERLKCIQESIEQVFVPDRLKFIVSEFIKRVDNTSYYDDIKDLMINAAEPVVKPLMDEAMIDEKVLSSLGYFGAYLRRRAIGEVLAALIKRYGPEVVTAELQERLNDKKWYFVRNAIELFAYLQEPSLVKLLEGCLKNPDINLRKKVIFILNKIPGSESTRLLIESLRDRDSSVCLNAIQSLGRIADQTVLEALKNVNQPDLQTELSQAIVSVEKLLKGKLKRSNDDTTYGAK